MLALDVAQYLDTLAVVTFDASGVSGNCFLETLPHKPDLAVMVKSTGGPAPSASNPHNRPTLQFLVRGSSDPRPAQALAQAIWTALHHLTETELTPGGTYVGHAWAMQSEPVSLGTDEQGRHEYSVNIAFATRRD
jgi:hypothetical protein